MALPVTIVIMRGQNNATMHLPPPRPRQTRKDRLFKPRLDMSSFTDEEVVKHFRLTKAAINQLYEELKQHIGRKSHRSHAISGISKLLAVLHFFASGSFQYSIASKMGFTQPTFSRCLRQVVDAKVALSKKYIKFPYNDSERDVMKQIFYEKYGMPLTIGLIDCTHIALIPTNAEEQSYRNRKMLHSLNVQMICGPSGEILDVVARFPGGTHDAFVLSSSGIGQLFQSDYFQDDILLGDNGYRLSPWLLTPYLAPRTDAQQRFNTAHKRTRSMVEHVFGQIKSRFRCLDVTGGALLYNPVLVGKIVLSCAVLHNIALLHQIPIEIASDLRASIDCPPVMGHESSQAGNDKRNEIAFNYFSR
ncbi:putative nuclease HARBI1 isoform X1 [Hyla sarda]|uniref:putative nuclease HARBI1 isoform X1 n=1 Tax=Hyla sarda TaxID=327740 RepID=UPI0024C30C86|nr:putative nuclease HARBI1 isoform X1 [Hyla sarda]XP_056381958.1 putative nuclease HARBI1 isoform X1 [Hyla sarda]XP_056381959.1 putative nuclease HARBI1 isoform X1 [Hyla sarda]XP_056381960.1 putative nuclease HARBI1 isoform X1 [Hyla sarda]